MIITIIAIIVTLVVSFSFGLLTERIIETIDQQTIGEELPVPILVLLGFFLVSFILMLVHFFIPIGRIVYLCIISASIIILYLQQKEVKKVLSQKLFPDSKQLLLIPFLIISAAVLISHSIDPIYEYDLGLYHLQNSKWFQTFAIVPGLGNLHGRFAFNSNWFLIESLFGNQSIFGQPVFPINIDCIFIFILFLLSQIGKSSGKTISGKFVVFILIFSSLVIFDYSNSVGTDKPSDIFIWIIIILFLLKIENLTIRKWDKYSWVILLLSIFVFTIKVSSTIILLLPATLFLLTFKTEKRKLLFPILVSLIYVFIWLIRNSIISGAAIFPIPFLQLPIFDWSMPKTVIEQMTDVIYCWAVKPHASISEVKPMSFIEKFIEWRKDKTIFLEGLILTGFLGNFLLLIYNFIFLLWKRKKDDNQTIPLLILHLYFCVALTYWYLSAPDPRFAFSVIFAATSMIIAKALQNTNFSKVIIDAMLLTLLILTVWKASITIPWNQLPEYYMYPPTVTKYEIKNLILSDGSIIHTPVEGDQCWDAPLPCSGWIYDGLIMRSKDLSDGFQIQK